MDEPTFDGDGYPTEETLAAIGWWPVNSAADFAAVMDFVGRAWKYPDRWECEPGWRSPDWPERTYRRYVFSTGGWSGNESLVGAIKANRLVEMVGAWEWRRGGHYEYRFPES